ncbi:MAG: hypothetical protein Fur0012_01040 [Elusimicrobiota bacterium]
MPKIKIDGKEYVAREGETVLQCAERNGIYIPRYCYHPSLSVSGNCRMCLVEIEKMPKLQIACSTLVSEGMNVSTTGEKVKKARKDVLEFLLKNHPVDCPICDQAGECYLQDYYMDYGLHKSRVSQDEKIRRDKRKQAGDYLILDNERCILCTRCVRFCAEVTKTEELFVSQRGDHSFIDFKPGCPVNNPYSLNIADICPVGAFTSADFRFRQRVWMLKTVESVCLGCATGCRIKVQYNNNIVYRIMPLPNVETNTWLCDAGRMTYKELYAEKRLRKITVQGKIQEWKYSSPVIALFEYIKDKNFSETAVFLSPWLSLEDNLALYYFASIALKTENIFAARAPERKISDGILRNTDKAPNSAAVELIKNKFSLKDPQEAPLEKISFVIAFQKEAEKYSPEKEGLYFCLTENSLEGALVPVKSYFETEGTFINWQNYARKTFPAVSNLNKFTVWETLLKLASYFSVYLPFSSFSDFEKIISQEGLNKEFN